MTLKKKNNLKKQNKNKNKNKRKVSQIKTYQPRKVIDYKKVKDSVSEFKKARAMSYDEQEKQDIITGKMVERVQLQRKFRGAYLLRLMKEARLFDMRERITNADQIKKEEVDWLGYYYSLDHIKAVYNYEVFELKTLISNEVYLKQGLMNVGFNDEQLDNILHNEQYIKDHDVLIKMEKDHEKEKDKVSTN
jgi:hypothetical protein